MAGMISVSILSNRLPSIAAQLPGAVRAVIGKTVSDVESGAKSRAAVDTGAMRNSIQGHITGDASGEVSVGAEYGIYQEYGTHKMPAHPFMHPAADAARPGFEAAVAALVSKI